MYLNKMFTRVFKNWTTVLSGPENTMVRPWDHGTTIMAKLWSNHGTMVGFVAVFVKVETINVIISKYHGLATNHGIFEIRKVLIM